MKRYRIQIKEAVEVFAESPEVAVQVAMDKLTERLNGGNDLDARVEEITAPAKHSKQPLTDGEKFYVGPAGFVVSVED